MTTTENTDISSTYDDLPPFVIAIDDREKPEHRFRFSESVNTAISHLSFGDYSLVGFERRVAIERKSIPDLVNTIWSHTTLSDGSRQRNSERFAHELSRMRDAGARRYVAVEGTEDDLRDYFARRARVAMQYSGSRQRANYETTMGFISSLEMRYGTAFKFFRNADVAAAKVYESLHHAYRLFTGLSRDPVGNYKPPHDGIRIAKPLSHDTAFDVKEKSGA